MKKSVAIILFALLFVCLFFFVREYSRPVYWKEWSNLFTVERFQLPDNLPAGDTAYIPACPGYELHRRQHYIFSYSERDRLSKWVAYELTPCELIKVTTRTDRFTKDSKVKNGINSDEYKNSGYDRGHLAPAGDMAFSEDAMRESFLMSNITPQIPSFNRGIWNNLENQVRNWVREDGNLYVVTGVIWDSLSPRMPGCCIPVPDYYYKVLFDTNKESKGMIVFLIPHSHTTSSFFDYAITVDSLEALTSIDFFPQLPDSLEKSIEAKTRIRLWKNCVRQNQ